MSTDFARPAGEPSTLRAAADQILRAAADVDSQNARTASAAATSLGQWQAPRADTFRRAAGGLQAELMALTTATEQVASLITAYAGALEQAQGHIASLHDQSVAAERSAEEQTARLDPSDPRTDQVWQHAATRQRQLAMQAEDAAADLSSLATRVAGQIAAETDVLVPGTAGLSDAELQRRVDGAYGVPTTGDDLTDAEAWAALEVAAGAVPADAVGADGEVDWTKAVAAFNDTVLGPPTTGVALVSTPAEGWAVWRMLANQRALAADAQAMRAAFSEIVGPVAYRTDYGAASWTELNEALLRFRNGADAVESFQAPRTAQALEGVRGGGMPGTGVIGALGRLAAVLGVAADVMTIIDPGVDNEVEGAGLRVTAGVNIVGTGMAFAPALATLVGINAVADWIPVVGQVVMVVSGLILAGDYIYHHWDGISHFVTDTVPDAVGSAADAVGDALSDGAHAVGHFFSSLF